VAKTGGTAPFVFSVSVGALPAGLTLDAASGLISGKPSAVGNYTFTLAVADSELQQVTRQYTVTIQP